MERQAERIAGGDEVGEFVDVRDDIVRCLGMQVREEGLDGAGEDERSVEGGGRRQGRRWRCCSG